VRGIRVDRTKSNIFRRLISDSFQRDPGRRVFQSSAAVIAEMAPGLPSADESFEADRLLEKFPLAPRQDLAPLCLCLSALESFCSPEQLQFTSSARVTFHLAAGVRGSVRHDPRHFDRDSNSDHLWSPVAIATRQLSGRGHQDTALN
jgi:hypothetical protein